ncbi:MAG: PA2817 family protein [Cellvibrio sp.]
MSVKKSPEQDYQSYHLQLLQAFVEQVEKQLPFIAGDCSEDDQQFLSDLRSLHKENTEQHFLHTGQALLCRVVVAYPHLMPLLYRDLLWFFGGDCLHFMPDDEIARYQQLDELRYEAMRTESDFSYADERAKCFGLH